jgi:hypothetical protein
MRDPAPAGPEECVAVKSVAARQEIEIRDA